MRIAILLFLFLFAAGFVEGGSVKHARCTPLGRGICHACTNCNYCGWCNSGGRCSVCASPHTVGRGHDKHSRHVQKRRPTQKAIVRKPI